MKFNIKIWHWLMALWLLIIILRHNTLIDFVALWIKYVGLFFSDLNASFNVLDFQLFDALLSVKIFVVVPILLLLFHKSISLLKRQLNFAYAFLILLATTFLLAPIIADENPEFQKNLGVTKLLKPFTSVKVIHLEPSPESAVTESEKFLIEKKSSLKPSFNESIIYADSVITGSELFYFQKNKKFTVPYEKVLMENGEPVIGNKWFVLGSDEFGRDIFARLIYGARISILVGICSVVLSLLIGLTLGFVAGYNGGMIDIFFTRLTELFLAFPIIYLVVLVLALFGSSLLSVILVLGISGWMSLFKVVKSEVVAVKQKDFMITAKLIGLSKSQLLLKEILPVIIVPVIVNLIFQFSNVVLAESALSYLGLSGASDHPSWGAMIDSGQEYITKAWWMIIFPGACLIFTLFSANVTAKRLNKFVNPGAN